MWPRIGTILGPGPRFADAVIIATTDRDHAEPAIAFADDGYAMLLEKPMATNPTDCRRIVEAVQRSGIIFAVFHDFRYFRYTQRLKAIVDSGAIGEWSPSNIWSRSATGTMPTPMCAAIGATKRTPPPCSWPNPATTSIGCATSWANPVCRSPPLAR